MHEELRRQTEDLVAAARRDAEDALQQSEARTRVLFESMLDGFALYEIICDEAGNPIDARFLQVNPAFERFTGLGARKVVGRTVLETFPWFGERRIAMCGRVALTGEPIHLEDVDPEQGKYFRIAVFSPQQGQFAVIF